MYDQISLFIKYWSDGFQWSLQLVLDSLWDVRGILIFLIIWLGIVAKKWYDLGWKDAGVAVVVRVILAMKALLWPALVLAVIFVFILLFVAPATRYKRLDNLHTEAQVRILGLQEQIDMKAAELEDSKKLLDERRQTIEQLQEANERLQDDYQKLFKGVRSRKAEELDKAARKARADKLALFFHDGETIKKKCFVGLSDSPQKDFGDWQNQVMGYLKAEMDSSHLIIFADTRTPNMRLQYQVNGKPVAKECNEVAKVIDMKLEVLREFLSELNK